MAQVLGELEALGGCQRCRFVQHILSVFTPDTAVGAPWSQGPHHYSRTLNVFMLLDQTGQLIQHFSHAEWLDICLVDVTSVASFKP